MFHHKETEPTLGDVGRDDFFWPPPVVALWFRSQQGRPSPGSDRELRPMLYRDGQDALERYQDFAGRDRSRLDPALVRQLAEQYVRRPGLPLRLRSSRAVTGTPVEAAAREFAAFVTDIERHGAFLGAISDCVDDPDDPTTCRDDEVCAAYPHLWPVAARASSYDEENLLDAMELVAKLASKPSDGFVYHDYGRDWHPRGGLDKQAGTRLVAFYSNHLLTTYGLPYRMNEDGKVENALDEATAALAGDLREHTGEPRLDDDIANGLEVFRDRHATRLAREQSIASLMRWLEPAKLALLSIPDYNGLVNHLFNMSNNYGIRHGHVDAPKKRQQEPHNPSVLHPVLLRLTLDLIWVARQEGLLE